MDAPNLPFFRALAAIESGCNDFARGRAGEVSRYQIKPWQWRRFWPLKPKYYQDPVIATEVSRRILSEIYSGQSVESLYTQWNTGQKNRTNETSVRFRNLLDYEIRTHDSHSIHRQKLAGEKHGQPKS